MVDPIDEIAALRDEVERLQIERLRLMGYLEEHLSPDLVQELLSESHTHALGGVRENVVVFFSDLRGFTRFSGTESVDAVVRHLNQFFNAMTTVLFKHGATVDKFIGDAILAFFRDKDSTPEQTVERSIECALAMQERFGRLCAGWKEGCDLGLGMGLAYGEVILGHVGSGKHVDFTVIGRPVNLAARLCGRAAPGEILIDESLWRFMARREGWEPHALKSIKGISQKLHIYRHR